MWAHIRGGWETFIASFHRSETIYWARLQILLGALVVGMQSVDMSAFISDRQMLQYYIFANAIITEMLRRHRSDFGDPK